MERYYAVPAPGCRRSFLDLEASCAKREGWRPYKSPQPLLRALSAGLAAAYWLPPDGVEAAGQVAFEVAALWLAFVGGAGAVPKGEQRALRARVAALRHAGVWGDAAFASLNTTFGSEALQRMESCSRGPRCPDKVPAGDRVGLLRVISAAAA